MEPITPNPFTGFIFNIFITCAIIIIAYTCNFYYLAFLSGRKKELIIFGGRNYYPQDIERVVHGLELVRPGSVVAFGTKNGHDEGIVIVAAPRDPQIVKVSVRGCAPWFPRA